mmetsp:Transcript_37569/g.61218  ORF Transcript_37569/g.61218 Transcript_37569/m.61218 type:complete len:92 (+) Transcript_37569:3434-3709(+)
MPHRDPSAATLQAWAFPRGLVTALVHLVDGLLHKGPVHWRGASVCSGMVFLVWSGVMCHATENRLLPPPSSPVSHDPPRPHTLLPLFLFKF